MTWLPFALLSAFFASLTAILSKIGTRGISSNLATAISSVVVMILAWIIVFSQGIHKQIPHISPVTLVVLFLSGVATCLSWLAYFHALQIGNASQVVSIDKLSLIFSVILAALLFQEKITPPMLLGIVSMVLGAILISLSK